MSDSDFLSWGIEVFDISSRGLPKNQAAILETGDHKSGLVALGYYLYEGLRKNEVCALLTVENHQQIFRNLDEIGISLEPFFKKEQLFILNYQPSLKLQLGIVQDYNEIFSEFFRLCDGVVPQRLAIHQVDHFINMNSNFLVNLTAQKLAVTARAELTKNTSILGQFVKYQDEAHHNLAVAFEKEMAAYYVLQKNETQLRDYYLQTKKVPWFSYTENSESVFLDATQGFKSLKSVKPNVA